VPLTTLEDVMQADRSAREFALGALDA